MINISEYSPILSESKNFTQSVNGDQILAYRIVLPEIYSLSENQLDEIHSTWVKALKNLPKCIFLKQDYYIKREYDGKKMPADTYLQKATKKNAIGKIHTQHVCNIFFINAGNRYLKSGSITNPFKKPPSEDAIKKQIQLDQAFKNEISAAIEFLKGSSFFSIAPLQDGHASRLAKLYFNGFENDKVTDIIREDEKLYIGEKRVGTFVIKSVKQLPENVYSSVVDSKMSTGEYQFFRGMFDGFGLELSFDHVYNQILFFDPHSDLKKEVMSLEHNLHQTRQFSPDNKKGSKDLKKYIDEMADDDNIRLVKAHFNITFFAEDQQSYKTYQAQITQRFKELDITPYYPTGNIQANIYNHSFFTYASGLDKQNAFIIDLQQAVCLFSNISSYREDKEGIYFTDRVSNLPLLKDIWDAKKKYIKARNFIIVAPTGEGKSVLANTIFSQLLDQGYYIVINDLGDSYKKLALLYPDITVYLEFEPGKSLGINPFYVEKGTEPDIIKINELVEFVRTLYLRDKQISDEEVSIRKILNYYYQNIPENRSFPNFYYFVEFLNKEKLLETKLEIDKDLFNAKSFLHLCSEFVGNGSYAFLFPSDAKELDIDLSGKRLVINEFGKAAGDPLLISILLNLSNAIDRKLIWEDKTKRGYTFYDECAKQMKFPNVLNTLEWKFQSIRKQEGGIGIVLQSPNQLPKNETAESIIDNTQMYFILNNTGGYEDIVKRFKFSNHQHHQLKSITNNFSADAITKYSEFMFTRAKHSNILRIHLAEAVRCAYLTEGPEHMKIMDLYNEHNSMEIAINKFMSKNNELAS